MVTGDYHHTAIAVARGVGIIPPGGSLVIIQAESERQPPTSALKASATPSNAHNGSVKTLKSNSAVPHSVAFSQRAAAPQLGLMQREPFPPSEAMAAGSVQSGNVASARQWALCQGLTFTVSSGSGYKPCEAQHALTSMAQVDHRLP